MHFWAALSIWGESQRPTSHGPPKNKSFSMSLSVQAVNNLIIHD